MKNSRRTKAKMKTKKRK